MGSCIKNNLRSKNITTLGFGDYAIEEKKYKKAYY